MAVSPNGKFLALFTSEGKLWVVSTDFQKNLSEFATKSGIPPQQLAWYDDLIDNYVVLWSIFLITNSGAEQTLLFCIGSCQQAKSFS